jgi:hypothetical protein
MVDRCPQSLCPKEMDPIMRVLAAIGMKTYYRRRGVTPADLSQAAWLKSTYSNLNGSCFELSRLTSDRIGVRDTKDQGTGPVLVFTEPEWGAFLAGAKEGQFDQL